MLGQEDGVDYRQFLPDKRIAKHAQGEGKRRRGILRDIPAISGKEEFHKT